MLAQLFALAILAPGPVGAAPGNPLPAPTCAADNGGLELPDGFCALLVASDSLGPVRHLAVASNGDVLVAHRQRGLLLLRDTNGDGTADERHWILRAPGGNGVVLTDGAIIFATNDSIVRIPLRVGALEPTGPVVTLARGLPARGHNAKGLALGADGVLYVSFGSLSNSCQKQGEDRRGPFPAPNPCPELPERAGIWKLSPDRPDQVPSVETRHATGLRNPMAMAVEPSTATLYAAIHGRDALTENWSFPAEEGRENPAEEFGPIHAGADYGWPYCYYDPRARRKVQAPEYGGDGKKIGDCDRKTQPAIAFPAHWAPNALTFYTGSMFPAEYRGGAFLAFHGSWNRAPAPQEGYRVVFIPFAGGKPVGTWRDFAVPSGAPTSIRPTGLAVGPDGSLFISDDANGKIWRVIRR